MFPHFLLFSILLGMYARTTQKVIFLVVDCVEYCHDDFYGCLCYGKWSYVL